MQSQSTTRNSAARNRHSSRTACLSLAALAVSAFAVSQAHAVPITKWYGDDGAFGDATKWRPQVVPDTTQIALITDNGTGLNTVATISAGDSFHVLELAIGNGETTFAGSLAYTGSGTLAQTGGTLAVDTWFTVGRPGGTTYTGTYNFSGGTASKAGDGLFSICLGDAGASVMNMSGNAIFNNTGIGDTRIGAGAAGGTLNMSGTSQLNHTQAEFKVGDGFTNVGNLNMSGTSLVTVNNRATFIGIFGGDGFVTMNNGSRILKTGAVGQFAICDSFNQAGDSTNGTITMHDTSSIEIATAGALGVDGEFWVGQGFNGNGTLTMDGTSSVTVRNRVMIARSTANGTFNLGGNASFTIAADAAGNSDFSVGIFDQGKGIVNQTGGTLNVLTGFSRIGDGVNFVGDANNAARAAQRSEYNMSGGVAHFGRGIDVGAFGDAGGLLNISGGAADAAFMFVATPTSRAANELRISGGSLTINGDIDFGSSRDVNASATVNLSGTGLLKMNRAEGLVTVGEQTLATINMTGTSRFESNAYLLLGARNASESTAEVPIGTGSGVINLNGGTLAAVSIRKGLGNGTVNFNGGTLQAMADEADFIRGFAAADLVNNTSNIILDSNAHAVTVNAALGGTGGLTKVGAGRLELTAVQQYAGRTRIEAGTLRTNATTGVSRFTKLEFAGTAAAPIGQLDIAGKPLVIDYTGTNDLNAIRLAAAAGLAAGSTSGITSAGMPSNHRIGYAEASSLSTVPAVFGTVDSTSVVIRETVGGDANLDGTVGFPDLVSLAQSYNLSGKFWRDGDFNYDGTVAFPDLVILAQNYNQSLSPVEASQLGSSFTADFALAQSLVPEPTTLGLVAGLGSMLLGRRRAKA